MTLERQIRELKAVSYGPADYQLRDYAITVGALVGTGADIEDELSRIIGIGTARNNELRALTDLDAKLAEMETAYSMSRRAAHEYERIFGELLEEGYGGVDRLLGSPIFNNWLTLYDDILPLLADRLSEVRRIRKQLDARRTQLREHNRNVVSWLESLKKHLDRVREMKATEASLGSAQPDEELVSKIEDGQRKVTALSNELITTNQRVREKAKHVFEQQKAAYKTSQWMKGIVEVFRLGFSATAGAAGSDTAMSATSDG